MTASTTLLPELGIEGLSWSDLFDPTALAGLDARFLAELKEQDAGLYRALLSYRNGGSDQSAIEASDMLVAIAPVLERFIARLFGIESNVDEAISVVVHDKVIFEFKSEFVQRRGKRYKPESPVRFNDLDPVLDRHLEDADLSDDDRELAVALFAHRLLQDEEANAVAIEELTAWCSAVLHDPQGQAALKDWVSFKLPQRLDYGHLVPLESLVDDAAGRKTVKDSDLRRRDGFALTDPRMSAREVQSEINYCVWCHDKDGDFCSKGFPEKKGKPELGPKVNPLGSTLTGCPLEEKISEMHLLKRDGHIIGALSVAMIDNPMIPATGHRICNDCMKGCIYQKQDPVNIPEIETRVLTDVLDLPWGVEIYDLLTRWNPLRTRQYVMQAYNGRKVLIAGMGPAGFTMAHHLTMEGCAVVGVEGLKIEPLPDALVDMPIRDYAQIQEGLDDRVLAGFGGVAEYGITVRWDKNFLRLIYISLARRANFQVFGGTRLGGTITLEDAWELGFDHACFATGAGLPRVIPMTNSLARGMRQANDFLMALQLTGAAKTQSLANLQVRLPAVVIGGGLTAIDTATEVQAYYIKQVEKTLMRHQQLVELHSEELVRGRLGEEDLLILDEFLEHGRAVLQERMRAKAAGEAPDFVPLLRSWGGVTVAYRRGLNQSPAYLRNHEEVIKAMEEGIYYAEGLEPISAGIDGYKHISALTFRRMKVEEGRWMATSEEVEMHARGVFVAAGAFPNTIYEHEREGTFKLDGTSFLPHVSHGAELQPVQVAAHCKSPEFGAFTSYSKDGHTVSFIGDTHPVFHGSVVKAIASAQRSYPEIMETLSKQPDSDADPLSYESFKHRIADLLTPRVASISHDIPGVVELWIRAPLAARNFRPGQFFRLQTFEQGSQIIDGTRVQIPVLTASGAGVEDDKIRLMVLQGAPLPKLTSILKPGDPLILMGPNGTPSAEELAAGNTVLVIAQQWGAAVMLTLGKVLREAGKRVLFFAMPNDADQIYHRDELEQAADQVVWCTATEPAVEPARASDSAYVNRDIIKVLEQYRDDCAAGKSGIRLDEVDSVLVLGGIGVLKSLQSLVRDNKTSIFKDATEVFGAVGSPMQCMLKGVCGQCLNWQVDPETGKRTRPVFSCSMQDQPLAWIDLDNMMDRLMQNRLADNISGLWIDHLLDKLQ